MGNISIIVAVYSCIGFFTFVTPLILHLVTRKYVTNLDYNTDKDTYIASTINFLCITRETKFKVEDVKVPDVPGLFTTLIAKGKALFLDPQFFDSPDHYSRLMGYDKPIDFKMYAPNTDSSDSCPKPPS
ncbi:hypothetical protein HHI36_020336 [Cryptolaemus montrouzieri]|uniref:Uncharacterized protein n=1 Tax=Cryptolaemus montrouzieri TaxID=559131 RepID=A0ABD2NA73_9CUCU